jgi:hypothetical protein
VAECFCYVYMNMEGPVTAMFIEVLCPIGPDVNILPWMRFCLAHRAGWMIRKRQQAPCSVPKAATSDVKGDSVHGTRYGRRHIYIYMYIIHVYWYVYTYVCICAHARLVQLVSVSAVVLPCN